MTKNQEKARFSFEEVKDYTINLGFTYDDETIQLKANLFNAISDFINNKLDLRDIDRNYDYLVSILLMEDVSDDDQIRILLGRLDMIPEALHQFTEEEKCGFAFCVYYPVCVKHLNPHYDGATALADFTSIAEIKRLFEEHRKYNPQMYELFGSAFEADETEPFGYSRLNPIITTNQENLYNYLNSLTLDGQPVRCFLDPASYEYSPDFIEQHNIINPYSEDLHPIYIFPHGKYNSTEAPEGFQLSSEYLYLNTIGDNSPIDATDDEYVGEYDQVYDFKVLADAFLSKGEDGLFSRASRNCIYISEGSGVNLVGRDEITAHFKHVREAGPSRHFCFEAVITDAPAKAGYPVGTACLLLAAEDPTNYTAIVFVNHNEDGKIRRIKLVKDPAYRLMLTKLHCPENAEEIQFEPYETGLPIPEDLLSLDFYRKMLEVNNEMISQGKQGLGDYACIGISNVLTVMDEFADHTLSFDDLLGAFRFIKNVDKGLEEFSISSNDSYRDVVRALRNYPSTKDIPNVNMKLFAFALWYALVNTRYDEETNTKYYRTDEFDSVSFIQLEYADLLDENPEFFSINLDL